MFDIHYMSFPHTPYELLPPQQNVLGARHFFLVSSFIFIAHFLAGLRELV